MRERKERIFKAKVDYGSREFTKSEAISLTDFNAMVKLDEHIEDEGAAVVLDLAAYFIVDVTNKKSEKENYNVYVYEAEDGVRYYTSSESAQNAIEDIVEAYDSEFPIPVKFYKKPSKNYSGKMFITASVI